METLHFQAETRRLLDLVIHSLYTDKEIFLRELVSNASDALDKVRLETLTRPELAALASPGEIRLVADEKARTLTITDTGVGMSREELIANIGTIARSGTRELKEKLKQEASPNDVGALIGQFGVGFYSAFMVADKVTLVTRRLGDNNATQWESAGGGEFSVGEGSRETHGTTITLHLKPADAESGMEDFTSKWVLQRIVRRHSDFIAYPIKLGEETLNSMQPIWTRPAAEVKAEEYRDFHTHLTGDPEAPLRTLHLKAEGTSEYEALLFIPAKAPSDLHFQTSDVSIRLYAKRVLILEDCHDLLPKYLRFVQGVVDCADLPLNVSRQTLQEDRHVARIRKWLGRKVLDSLKEIQEKEPEQYAKLWAEVGRAIKEGVTLDPENKDRILALLTFESSKEKATTLGQYVARMKPDQAEIYWADRDAPQAESLVEQGIEVLWFTDPVDEFVAQSLWEFEGKKLKCAAKGKLFPASEEQEKDAAPLLEWLRARNEKLLKGARLSGRLKHTPACLVSDEHEMSPQLERLMARARGEQGGAKRTLELNPEHPVFAKLKAKHSLSPEDPALADLADLVVGCALLAEGSELPEPARFVRLLGTLMDPR